MYKLFGKRLIDIIGSIILIILTAPLMLVIAIIVKIDRGEVLYKQARSGKNGKEFTFFKFGSCVLENNATDFTCEDELTKSGRFIRKTSLDELPQLFLILSGKMSFIGPRPWMVEITQYFTNEQRKRFNVTPGITGLAQCSGRNDLTILERIEKDIEYVNNVSLKTDIYVIFKTIKSVFIKQGYSSSKFANRNDIEILKDYANNGLEV